MNKSKCKFEYLNQVFIIFVYIIWLNSLACWAETGGTGAPLGICAANWAKHRARQIFAQHQALLTSCSSSRSRPVSFAGMLLVDLCFGCRRVRLSLRNGFPWPQGENRMLWLHSRPSGNFAMSNVTEYAPDCWSRCAGVLFILVLAVAEAAVLTAKSFD